MDKILLIMIQSHTLIKLYINQSKKEYIYIDVKIKQKDDKITMHTQYFYITHIMFYKNHTYNWQNIYEINEITRR